MESSLFAILEILGTIAFAVSGSLAAMQRRMDLFGIFIIAFVTAIGGGTLRDVLIGQTPPFWMENTIFVYLVGATTVLSIIFRTRLNYLRRTFLFFDAVGLGVFTITGVELGIHNNLDPIISVALGAMTGAFGGVIRDTLCNEIPVIFRKENIYATASIIGGFIFILLYNQQIDRDIIYIVTSLTVITIRLLAVKYHITLPNFSNKEGHIFRK